MQNGKKILVIDDSQETRMILKKGLEKNKFTVMDKENGKEGLAAFTEGEFDLIVVDYMMPEMDGMQVIKAIRQKKTAEQVPIILLTGKQEKELIAAALKHGINDFLLKPVKISMLTERISKILLNIKDQDLGEILNGFNMPDASPLTPKLKKLLKEQGLNAYPFTYEETKCCGIIATGVNPQAMASKEPNQLREDLTILAKGGYLWNVVWPLNSATKLTFPIEKS